MKFLFLFKQALRSLLVKNFSLYRTATLLYFACFAMYILFSRQPDYFGSELVSGTVVEAKTLDANILKKYHIVRDDYPVIKYNVGSESFYYDGRQNYFQRSVKHFDNPRVIYDPGNPRHAELYDFWGYWIVPEELFFSILGFAFLFGVAISITGKNHANPHTDEDLEKQMKYN